MREALICFETVMSTFVKSCLRNAFPETDSLKLKRLEDQSEAREAARKAHLADRESLLPQLAKDLAALEAQKEEFDSLNTQNKDLAALENTMNKYQNIPKAGKKQKMLMWSGDSPKIMSSNIKNKKQEIEKLNGEPSVGSSLELDRYIEEAR
jgi:hypothetical protein